MESSKLKLNPDKTDLIVVNTKQQRNRIISHFPVKLLDSDLHFRQHISQVYKSVSIINVISVEFGVTYLYLLLKQYQEY